MSWVLSLNKGSNLLLYTKIPYLDPLLAVASTHHYTKDGRTEYHHKCKNVTLIDHSYQVWTIGQVDSWQS